MERFIFDTLIKYSFEPKKIKSDKRHLIIELSIRAKPGSKLEKITPGPEGEMIVFTRARPIEGAANIGIIKLLSKVFGIPQRSIAIKSGEKSKTKKLIITFEFSDTKDEGFFIEKFKSSYGKFG